MSFNYVAKKMENVKEGGDQKGLSKKLLTKLACTAGEPITEAA